MRVDVFAQQFAWSFGYPGKGNVWSRASCTSRSTARSSSNCTGMDVIHSFWVPEWRIKKDAVPGITTTAMVTPDKVGTYQLICTELCGFGHATMRAKVVVETPSDFREWVAGLEDEIPPSFLKADQTRTPRSKRQQVGAGGA